jgi:hypothetical protein
MASLNPAVALTALANVDVELSVDGLARNPDLELLSDVSFVERSAAVGAAVRQRRFVDLIDLFGAGRLAMCLGAVVWSGLASGFLGLGRGLSLGEGGGLALGGAGRLVELAAQALVLGLQVAEASLKGLAAGTRDGSHTPILGEAWAADALPRPQSEGQPELDALNKYNLANFLRQLVLEKTLKIGVTS